MKKITGTDFCYLTHVAQEIASGSSVAYWVESYDNHDNADFQRNLIQDSFERMAALLGYELTPITTCESCEEPVDDVDEAGDCDDCHTMSGAGDYQLYNGEKAAGLHKSQEDHDAELRDAGRGHLVRS